MKFAKMFFVILVAIFSLAMSSAYADQQGIGCTTVNSVEICKHEYVSPSGNKYTMPTSSISVEEVMRAKSYIKQICPQYTDTDSARIFVNGMGEVKFRVLSKEEKEVMKDFVHLCDMSGAKRK